VCLSLEGRSCGTSHSFGGDVCVVKSFFGGERKNRKYIDMTLVERGIRSPSSERGSWRDWWGIPEGRNKTARQILWTRDTIICHVVWFLNKWTIPMRFTTFSRTARAFDCQVSNNHFVRCLLACFLVKTMDCRINNWTSLDRFSLLCDACYSDVGSGLQFCLSSTVD
jgi:hypothetical protein